MEAIESRWAPRSSKPLWGVYRPRWVRLPFASVLIHNLYLKHPRDHERGYFHLPAITLKKKRKAFVYLLLCSDGTLYTGWTWDVARRLQAHQKGRGARYTRVRRPLTLVYQEELASQRDAMRREIQIKRMSRARKFKLMGK